MQRLAANAIMNMAYDCAESRVAIAEAGAIPPLVAMLKIQSRSCQVHYVQVFVLVDLLLFVHIVQDGFAGAVDEHHKYCCEARSKVAAARYMNCLASADDKFGQLLLRITSKNQCGEVNSKNVSKPRGTARAVSYLDLLHTDVACCIYVKAQQDLPSFGRIFVSMLNIHLPSYQVYDGSVGTTGENAYHEY
jgi:hypothetical protein